MNLRNSPIAYAAFSQYADCGLSTDYGLTNSQYCCNATLVELLVCAKTYCESSSPFASFVESANFFLNDTQVQTIESNLEEKCGIKWTEIEEVGSLEITLYGALAATATTPYVGRTTASS
eukprot:GSA120T00015043001.1